MKKFLILGAFMVAGIVFVRTIEAAEEEEHEHRHRWFWQRHGEKSSSQEGEQRHRPVRRIAKNVAHGAGDIVEGTGEIITAPFERSSEEHEHRWFWRHFRTSRSSEEQGSVKERSRPKAREERLAKKKNIIKQNDIIKY